MHFVFQVEKKEIIVAVGNNRWSSCGHRPDCLHLDTCHDHWDPVLGGPEDPRSLQNRQQAQEELGGRGRGPRITHSVSASGNQLIDSFNSVCRLLS